MASSAAVHPSDLLTSAAGIDLGLVAGVPAIEQGAPFSSPVRIELPSRAFLPNPGTPPNASTSLRGLDRTAASQFALGQNFPNPYVGETTIPFTLTTSCNVRLDLFDCAGRKMASITRLNLKAGEHTINLNLNGLGLVAGDYTYQLQVTTSSGVYRQSKAMTAALCQ